MAPSLLAEEIEAQSLRHRPRYVYIYSAACTVHVYSKHDRAHEIHVHARHSDNEGEKSSLAFAWFALYALPVSLLFEFGATSVFPV